MTDFPTIIIYKVKAISFEIISLTTAIIKLKGFFKRIIGVYIASKQIKMVF
jgi:hypothetical protein